MLKFPGQIQENHRFMLRQLHHLSTTMMKLLKTTYSRKGDLYLTRNGVEVVSTGILHEWSPLGDECSAAPFGEALYRMRTGSGNVWLFALSTCEALVWLFTLSSCETLLTRTSSCGDKCLSWDKQEVAVLFTHLFASYLWCWDSDKHPIRKQWQCSNFNGYTQL